MRKSGIIQKYHELGKESENVIFKITKTKNIRIAINHNLQITVSFSESHSLKKAIVFFESKIIWVLNSLHKLAKRQQVRQNYHQKTSLKLSAEEFLAKNHYLILRCRNLAEKHNFAIKKVILRRQKSIWGSCSAHNNISLNSSLVLLKDELIDYVILHELVHTRIKNHSRKFWDELEKVFPNSRVFDKELKRFSPVSSGN